jgi:hypothetical protein
MFFLTFLEDELATGKKLFAKIFFCKTAKINYLSAKLFGMERYDTDSARASAQRQPDKLIVISAA